ncbi:MAG: hypothetical protein V7750_10730 [Sneathiella sp.]
MALLSGPFSGSSALAVTPDIVVMEGMDCEDCSAMENMQMSDTVCSSSCVLAGLMNKNNLIGSNLNSGKSNSFDFVNFSLQGKSPSPEPHPPKQAS